MVLLSRKLSFENLNIMIFQGSGLIQGKSNEKSKAFPVILMKF
jgi:hypothetical protein